MRILREGIAPLLARLLLSVIFVTSTMSKFFGWSDNVSYVATKLPMPCAMLLAALLIELLGSLSLILGFRARIAAAIMFVYDSGHVRLPHLDVHKFRKESGHHGGLLMIAAYGSGIYPLSEPL